MFFLSHRINIHFEIISLTVVILYANRGYSVWGIAKVHS